MNDSIFIFLIVLIVTGLIYTLYKLLLGNDKDNSDVELQITPEDLQKQLSILFKQKKYKIVEGLARKYLETKHADCIVRLILAKTLCEQGRVYDAIEHIKFILKLEPRNFDSKIFLANCYLEVSKVNKAIGVFQEILNIDPNNVVAIKELASAYLNTNQKKSAIRMFERLDEFLYSNQEKAKNMSIIAEIHVDFQEYALAINQYLEILKVYPEDITARKRLIELYKVTDKYSDVIIIAREILETEAANNMNSLWALQQLIDIYCVLKDYEKAFECANLIKEHPLATEIDAGKFMAKVLLEKGQYQEGIDILRFLAEQNHSNIDLKKSLAESYIRKKDFPSAIEIYKEILDLSELNEVEQLHFEMSNIYADWGLYCFSMDDTNSCFNKFTLALQYYSKNPDIYYKLANVNTMIKNYNEAIIQYKKAIEIDPENPKYYFDIAECYEAIDSVYDQKKALNDYIKYKQDNPVVYYKLALIFDSQKDRVSALQYVKKAVELNDKFIEAKHKLALILELKGEKDEAIRLYEEILRIQPDYPEITNNLHMLKSEN